MRHSDHRAEAVEGNQLPILGNVGLAPDDPDLLPVPKADPSHRVRRHREILLANPYHQGVGAGGVEKPGVKRRSRRDCSGAISAIRGVKSPEATERRRTSSKATPAPSSSIVTRNRSPTIPSASRMVPLAGLPAARRTAAFSIPLSTAFLITWVTVPLLSSTRT